MATHSIPNLRSFSVAILNGRVQSQYYAIVVTRLLCIERHGIYHAFDIQEF
jgi:hypothetical protein